MIMKNMHIRNLMTRLHNKRILLPPIQLQPKGHTCDRSSVRHSSANALEPASPRAQADVALLP
jgi:hypothetical protein